MALELTSLRGLDRRVSFEKLHRAVEDGALTPANAASMARELNLGPALEAQLQSTTVSGLSYGGRGTQSVGSGGKVLNSSAALFRGLLGFSGLGKKEASSKTTPVWLPGAKLPVMVPAVVAQRIDERIRFVATPDPGRAELQRELEHTNCRGAAMSVLAGVGEHAESFFADGDLKVVAQARKYGSHLELAQALRSVDPPAVLTFGDPEHHVAVFLGFDADGTGAVFQKGNMSANYPWELMSLAQLFEQHATPDYYGHVAPVGIAKLNRPLEP